MKATDWDIIDHFGPHENFGDPEKISYEMMLRADIFRARSDLSFIILCGTQGKHKGKTHGQGIALDGYAKGIDLLDMYIAAERSGFIGIGLYDWGIHLDIRTGDPARWVRIDYEDAPSEYLAMNAVNIDKLRTSYKFKGE